MPSQMSLFSLFALAPLLWCSALSIAAEATTKTAPPAATAPAEPGKIIRVGIIGCDTSHVPAFTRILNDPKAAGKWAADVAGVKVTAAYPGGSPDLAASRDRVEKFTQQLRDMNVEIVETIPALLEKVDAVMVESVDGRAHLEQVRPVLEAGKPVFIDKPLAGSLVDAVAIAELARRHNAPWFSSSSLRFSAATQAAKRDASLGRILGAAAWSPCPLEPTHPDLFWYGIHGVETLFTLMGPDCQSVSRTHTDGADVVVGVWKGGRIGTFRGIRDGKRDYGAIAFCEKGIASAGGHEGYEPLVVEIARFFKTRKAPVDPQETIRMMAFMAAADESKKAGGAPVDLDEMLKKAREAAEAKLEEKAAAAR